MRKSLVLNASAAMALTFSSSAARAESPDLAAEVARLRAEVDELRAELRALRASPPGQPAATIQAPAPTAAAQAPATEIRWKGAPEFATESGWSFKPRGRMQFDAGYLWAPERNSGTADGRDFTSEVRRAYIGFQGTMPGGFGYRIEADIATNAVELTDLYLTYDKGPLNVTLGQHYPFLGLEQQTSDLFTSFLERAAFSGAFNYERRLGLSAGYKLDTLMVNAGIFTDDVTALGNDGNKSYSVDGRVVWMPKLGSAQLHFGANAHFRDLNGFQGRLGAQYRQRPYLHATDIRYVDTGVLTASRETSLGLEAAAVAGRLHFAAEAVRFHVRRPVDTSPTFHGGYAEIGWFLTDDTRGYRYGAWERTTPKHPLGSGGIGAVQLNARYDRLDLTDGTILGGKQDSYGLSLIWMPTAYVRFLADYVHLDYEVSGSPSEFDADTVAMRAQIDF